MSVSIDPAEQQKRIQQLWSKLEAYKQLEKTQFAWKQAGQGWTISEVLQHMTIAHNVYIPKIEEALAVKSRLKAPQRTYKAAGIPGFLIKRFPPLKGQIRMKMKTTKIFEPKNTGTPDEVVIDQFSTALSQLQSWIEKYQTHTISHKRFNSAIGPIVRFSIPQACEFILCHNERHFQQIDNILQANGKA